jgi:hypothetical protein
MRKCLAVGILRVPRNTALAKMLEARQRNASVRFVVFNGYVHDYECRRHGGITYLVTGGGALMLILLLALPAIRTKTTGSITTIFCAK